VFIVICYKAPFFPDLFHLHTSSALQMPQHTETTFSYDIDTISKQVIQPISCNWSSCTATINSWLTLQKVCEFTCIFQLGIMWLLNIYGHKLISV
jgi:hypothetical protein